MQKLFRKSIIKGHIIFFTLCKSLEVFSYILYISEESIYPSFLLRLLRITLTYSEPQPTHSIMDLLSKIKQNSFTVDDGWDIFQRSVTRSLELSAFFLQFFSWWSQENYMTDIMSLPSPPPPNVKISTIVEYSNYERKYNIILCCDRYRKQRYDTKVPVRFATCLNVYIQCLWCLGKCTIICY